MPYAERSLQAADCQIHYLEGGTGRAVVMLHGAGGLRVDEPVFSELAARYHLLAPSLPGFDQSTAGSAATLRDVADVMAEFIRSSVGQASVIGESFGGGVSSWLAIRHPDVVERLILAASGGLNDNQAGGPRLSELSPAEMSVLLYGRPPTEQPSPAVAEQRQRNRANATRLIAGRGFDPDLYEQISSIRAPTLILWGTADRMLQPSQAKVFADRIPGSQLVMLDGAPHVLSAAVPEQFLPPVLGFLETGRAVAPATASG
jgi:pimeloyl-ACP methyl ester carboxylesterase